MTQLYLEQPLNGDVVQPKYDIYTPHTSQQYRLGTRYHKADGRTFHYAQANITAALVRGNVIQSAIDCFFANEQQDLAIATTAPVGSDYAYATYVTDALTEDFVKDGWYIVSDDVVASGGASIYQIKSHPAVAAAASTKFTFYDKINVQIVAGQKAGLIINPYKLVVQLPNSTGTGFVVGVAPVLVPASYYFWLQTWGMACVLVQGALTVGEDVVCAYDAAGTCDAQVVTGGSLEHTRIGHAGHTTTSTDWGFVYLQLAP